MSFWKGNIERIDGITINHGTVLSADEDFHAMDTPRQGTGDSHVPVFCHTIFGTDKVLCRATGDDCVLAADEIGPHIGICSMFRFIVEAYPVFDNAAPLIEFALQTLPIDYDVRGNGKAGGLNPTVLRD